MLRDMRLIQADIEQSGGGSVVSAPSDTHVSREVRASIAPVER